MRVSSSAVRRYVSLFSIICYLLPFVSVKECKTETVVRYHGYEMILHDGGWMYLVPVAVACLMLLVSFVKREWSIHLGGFSAAGACVLSGLSFCVVVFFPEIQFLFDDVRPLIGQVACALCWALLYAVCAFSVVVIIRSMHNRRLGMNIPRARFFPWTVLLVFCGIGLFVAPGLILAHDSAKEWLPVFIAVSVFISLPGLIMLYFVRSAIAECFLWGKLVSCSLAGGLAVAAVFYAWCRINP